MRYFKRMFLVVIITALSCLPIKAEMTVQELFFDNTKPFHLKILNVIPKDGIVQIGDDNAKNTIIEFMDYFCGYCYCAMLSSSKGRNDNPRIIF